MIDADEARVRSVPTRLGLTVAAQTPSNATVTLSDTAGDITATGTVTFSNPVINLGATSGTVTVTADGGTDGGTITGGGSAVYGIAELEPVADDLGSSFGGGAVSPFAQDHVVVGACP